MSAILAPEDKVLAIFKYCVSAFARYGYKVVFPANTPPHKTYKWRYVKKFIEKIDEFKISEDAAKRIIDKMVVYAMKNKKLHLGLSILASEHILSECCKMILEEDKMYDRLIDRLKADNQFVMNNDPLARREMRSLPNIALWFRQNLVSKHYMSISKKCHEAMVKLSPSERSLLPCGRDLVLIRGQLLKPALLRSRIRFAMGDDWRSELNAG